MAVALVIAAWVALAVVKTGTNKSETLTGTSNPDKLAGGGDTIDGKDGGDQLYGDFGADTLKAGDDADFINAADDTSVDTIECGGGDGDNDTVVLDAGNTVGNSSPPQDVVTTV